MMTRKLFFSTAFAAVFGTLVFGLTTVSAQTDDESAVVAVIRQNATAFAANDVATMDKIWADSEDVIVFESGYADHGWKKYRDHHLVPEMKEFSNTKYEYTDIKAKVSGGLAYATMKYSLSADVKNRRVESAGLATAVLEKRGGGWKIVHFHTSAPRRAPQPAQPAPKN